MQSANVPEPQIHLELLLEKCSLQWKQKEIIKRWEIKVLKLYTKYY